jgi:hypothetical protein
VKLIAGLTFLLIALVPSQAQKSTPAREYYKELYNAGGLDRIADFYVCFYDDVKNENFFIFADGKYLRDYMKKNGTFEKLPKPQQDLYNKDFLVFRSYAKGVPLSSNEFLTKVGDSWISNEYMADKSTPLRIRFNISWQTLRFKRSVELLNLDSTFRSEVPNFGRCEAIPNTILQHGPDN